MDYHLNQHEYPMPDHGLFVAGIIHSIAPKAQIHLIEGLNTYGVGTFETFANAIALAQRIALKQPLADVDIEDMGIHPRLPPPARSQGSAAPDVADVTQVRPDRAGTTASTLTPDYLPMVMNCSFVFTAPPEAGDDPLHRASSYLATIWDTLNIRDDMLIVGAAGNDARGEGSPAAPKRSPRRFHLGCRRGGARPARQPDALHRHGESARERQLRRLWRRRAIGGYVNGSQRERSTIWHARHL